VISAFLTREVHGVSFGRLMLAGAGLISAAVAILGADLGDPVAGLCLARPGAGLGHCGFCWAAIILLLAAATPLPSLRPRAARR